MTMNNTDLWNIFWNCCGFIPWYL